jgi:hypothetical protein
VFGELPDPGPDPIPEENHADVNGDGAVDVSDIALVIDYMSSSFYDKYADVNGDGTIDVADIFTVLTIMVGGETSGKE